MVTTAARKIISSTQMATRTMSRPSTCTSTSAPTAAQAVRSLNFSRKGTIPPVSTHIGHLPSLMSMFESGLRIRCLSTLHSRVFTARYKCPSGM